MKKFIMILALMLCMMPMVAEAKTGQSNYCNYSILDTSPVSSDPFGIQIYGNDIIIDDSTTGFYRVIHTNTSLVNITIINMSKYSPGTFGSFYNGSHYIIAWNQGTTENITVFANSTGIVYTKNISSWSLAATDICGNGSNYWVLDSLSGNITLLNRTFDYQYQIVIPANASGARGLACTQNGTLFVEDINSDNITQLTPQGTLIRTYNISPISVFGSGVWANNTDMIFSTWSLGHSLIYSYLPEGALISSTDMGANVSYLNMTNCTYYTLNFTNASVVNFTVRMLSNTVNSTIESCPYLATNANKTVATNSSNLCIINVLTQKLPANANITIGYSSTYSLAKGVGGLPLAVAMGITTLIVIYTYNTSRKSEGW